MATTRSWTAPDMPQPVEKPGLYRFRAGSWYYLGTDTVATSQAIATATITALAKVIDPVGGNLAPGANAGAGRPGTVTYATPADAIIISPTGNDANLGTVASPVATLLRARNLAASTTSKTIAYRAGVYYHGATLTPATHTAAIGFTGYKFDLAGATIQNYNGEAVWWDGSVRHTNWTQSGNYWVKPISNSFDYGHTDGYGQLDNDTRGEGWTWVRPDFPLAANCSQVFLDGVELTEVTDTTKLVPGTYCTTGTYSGTNNVLYTTSNYYVYPPSGKNPNTAETRVTNLYSALCTFAADVTLRGIGVRRYSNSNSQGGVIKANAQRLTCENVYLEDAATVGFSCYQADGSKWIACEAQRCGILGFKYHLSYDLVYDRCKAEYCNDQRFYWAPVSGGIKGTAGRNITIKDGSFSYNYTKGVWFDVSNYNCDVLNCSLDFNEQFGIVYEIGSVGVVANCTITNTGKDGILWHDQHDLQIWNCVFRNNGRLRNQITDSANPRNIKVYQDNRRLVNSPADGGVYPNYGRDPRQPVPDPTMNNWLIEKMTVCNNILDQGNLQFAYMPVEDLQKNEGYSRDFTQYGYTGNGNLYCRASTANPANGWAWLRPGAGTAQEVVTTFTRWKAVNGGQDTNSVEVIGAAVTDANGWLTPAAAAIYGDGGTAPVGIPIPAAIAAKIGVPAGTVHVGPFKTASNKPAWQTALIGTNSTPAKIGFLGDSITFGAGKYGNSAPKYRNSYPGQLRTALAATYGDAGTGWVLFNNDLIPLVTDSASTAYNVGWDDRVSVVGGVVETSAGLHGRSCWSIPDSGSATTASAYVQVTAKGNKFTLLSFPKTSGTSQGVIQVDNGTPVTIRNVQTGGPTPGVERLSYTPAWHVVTDITIPDDGNNHTIKMWGLGDTLDVSSWRVRTGKGAVEISNLGISGMGMGTMLTNDTTTGKRGQALIPTFNVDHLVIAIGANDYNGAVPLTTAETRLRTIIGWQRAAKGTDSVSAYFPPISSPTLYPGAPAATYADYGAMFARVCDELGVPFLDLTYLWGATFDQSNAVTPRKYADTLHPTDSGSADIAARFRSFFAL